MKGILQKLIKTQELNQEEIDKVIFGIKEDEFSPTQIAGFLMALLMKGPTTAEIAGIAKAMRRACVTINPRVNGDLTDTCGTGGGLTTFNISTANAIISAAAGVKIAKHGSRSISHSSGSADVLEALGIPVDLEPLHAEKLIEEIGFSFLYAPLYHPVMMKVFGPENDLGIKTIFFTIIGPVINPAGAKRHVLGVYQLHLVEQVAEVVREVGLTHAMVVHGMDGLDEISLMGETKVAEIKDGKIDYFVIVPEDFGMKRCGIDELSGGGPDDNAKIIMDIFEGKETGPRRDMLLLNTAATFVVADQAANLTEGLALARETLDSGLALAKLHEIRSKTQEIGGALH
ncbi:anthranilate phosphoribosyltransferase [Pelotomaculum sp. PtaB.Bin117]|nr:anthranilate phosphoribosyltransferase [Pelotomaculum sp. PtaB.Bin117]OPX89127.1 MAG: Anthranilate phosphoribosyltransferase [Pelotomaculum sp. PtaB.Bin117]OPY60533.1 MAG: Anthranilate phosphoribosyltransferase [Pelotomaculum sp. PtaU1.Bin065]